MDDGYNDVGNSDHACNGTLRGYKSSLFEGGNRVPFIASWPGQIKAGTQSDELITQLDMAATFASLTSQTLAAGAAPDSYDVLPALLGTTHSTPLRPQFVAHVGGTQGPFALRAGDWKLIQGGGGNRPARPRAAAQTTGSQAQLYNLKNDLPEKQDLSETQPEKVKELRSILEQVQKKTR